MKDFNKDFEFFTDLILSDKNFAYARYADGEVALMLGKAINVGSQAYNVDKWHAPGRLTKVGSELLESLDHTEDNYYYAISSTSDFSGDNTFLDGKIKVRSNITFANLWINANYQKMKAFYQNLKKEVYLVCNQKAQKESFPFTVAEIFPFPDSCIEYWEEYGDDYISQLGDYVSQLQNKTFFISCGPVSEVIIHRLYNINPNNQYIDVGSSIDEFVHGYPTRPYMNPASNYAKEVSYFKEYREVKNVEDLKILIPTCDGYIQFVEALMYTVDKYWPCKNQFVVLGYQPPKFKLKDNWEFVSLGKDYGPGAWSNGLIDYFKSFEDQHFINMCDESLMTRPSDINKVRIAFDYMLKNRLVKKSFLIGSLSSGNKALLGDIELTPVEELNGMFHDVNQVCDYRSSVQSAIWSTDYFLQLLKPNQSPWDFETQHAKNDGVRILTTLKDHPTMYSHLYARGRYLPDWYQSVFENTKLNDEDINHIATMLNIN
jgi:hypothetical protein